MKNNALSPPVSRYGSSTVTVIAQMTDGTMKAASQDATRRSRGESDAESEAAFGFLVGDHVHVDLAGPLHDPRADALLEDARPPGSSRGADHQLGGVDLAGEIQ